MKIIDACPFFNEIELLKIRLELLYDYVDGFCICESNLTHPGQPKPFHFLERQNEFTPWMDKIAYIQFQPDVTGIDFSKKDDTFNPSSPAWQMERAQRNIIADYAAQFNDDDVFIVSDLDELANPQVIQAIRSGQITVEKARLEMQMHYYFMNCKGVGADNKLWHQGFVANVSTINQTPGGLSHLRVHEPMPVIQNGGWHFSYLGGAERVSQKIHAAAHSETNRPEINNLIHLQRCLDLGIDHLARPGYEYAFVPVDIYPEPLAQIMRKNLNLVKTTLV